MPHLSEAALLKLHKIIERKYQSTIVSGVKDVGLKKTNNLTHTKLIIANKLFLINKNQAQHSVAKLNRDLEIYESSKEY